MPTAATTGLHQQVGYDQVRGRLKITQIRSKISEKQSQRDTLRSLGLKRIGDSVVREDNSQNRGYARAVAHLIKVEEIDAIANLGSTQATSNKVDKTQGNRTPSGGDEMSEIRQQIAALRDGVRVVDDGEFIEWHKLDDGNSLIWSSELNLTDLLGTIDTTIGRTDSRHRGLVDFNDIPGKPVTAEEAHRAALENPKAVTFLRLEYANGIAFVWTPTPGSEDLQSRSRFAEASAFYTAKAAEKIAQTLGKTATKHWLPLADIIAESVAA